MILMRSAASASRPGACAHQPDHPASRAALELVRSGEGLTRRDQLWSLITQLKTGLAQNGWPQGEVHSAIIPLIIGAESAATNTAAALRDHGIFVPAIRYPTVARGQARLRVTLTAAHTPAEVAQLVSALMPFAAQPHPAPTHA